ncbi:phosphatidylinositol N-acetylglucosaminyltransferase subunit P-like [Halichondria panicea]|uniref:phosphatidylinositol N-acetylglucosaminyltransferase subunit P-like n=1 Tax=Halichondria panicea TaxID=6063 RepID=UPI00312B5568
MVSDERRASPNTSSERATYGFVLYLGSYLLLGVFLLWAFLPNDWLTFIGFSYYPQKYWAVAVPVFGCVCFTMIFFLYIGANLLMVPAPDDLRNITDSYSLPPQPASIGTSVPPLYDIPITEVNKLMFAKKH